ncbi:bifunctional oligoribonuclease/PAP phosphatase NrnA [bacterium]|nr:bifunctional oligoribonuclease/PAP phosphatase NrnA [bacterium]
MISMLPQIESIAKELKKRSSFIIISHENPDGDSLGAQFAMALALISIGKKAQIQCKDPVPKIYDFLPGQEWLLKTNEIRTGKYDMIVCLDCADLDRSGLTFYPKPPPFLINIDHHFSNTKFGQLNWVDPSASATSEMIFHLLPLLDVEINTDIAVNLYTGIMTDTGSFQYSNTSAGCLNIAGRLVNAGANPQAISSYVYDRKTVPAIRLMGFVLNEMEIHMNGSLAILTVTKKMLDNLQATYEDTEELVSLPQKISGIEVSALIKEVASGEQKISLRSKGRVNVAEMARRFGGGGHPNAAGLKIEGELSHVKEKVLRLASEFIPFE